ncbi:tRNA uridine-5-carboxymethylaminomethyl(34) synthesis GTPase MnmE [Novosphingobium aquimarinum]|uniref:tRNA uridine-5-carboxymethylaminomethyl(34) synthesis GTPase MnmE n=1 Tax=Novosphingobium aquimarinum TaxID=2682494 RepID=UPI0012EB72FE|nr:tRNA uridine-5-carboxymethylaminomethyl(34) synthesis GTPase MnmE [Novosphingobium aquimarinum]
MTDTIFALSSGAPPAALAVIRISGPDAGSALSRLSGSLPQPRRASLRRLQGAEGALLDEALVLWFPGPSTATGEDLAELHCHGGRAVVAAVEAALAAIPELRRATAGEFTRRAFANGRIDLAEAEGLADLLSAETEWQRANALALSQGQLSRQIDDWRRRILMLAAGVEALLDFGDEDDVGEAGDVDRAGLAALIAELDDWLASPHAEALREGLRVVIAGPPNSGKSTLFNALVGEDAAITSDLAGTTRDVLQRPVAILGAAFQFLDTAGLRAPGADRIEALGMERARQELLRADLVLWLGPEGEGPEGAWEVEAQCDRSDHAKKSSPRHRVSAITGDGLSSLREDLVAAARTRVPRPGRVALNARQRTILADVADALKDARAESDLLLVADGLRAARAALDALVGRTTTEDMLDALFGRFCIGK